jgi:hypothetical protein
VKRGLFLVLLLLSVLGVAKAQDTANWTILHYTDVDNNLEAAAFNDLKDCTPQILQNC